MGFGGGVDHVLYRQVVQQQLVGLDVDLVLGQLAADGDDLRHARHGEQPVPQVVLAERTERRVGHAAVRRRERQQHDLAGDAGDRRHLDVDALGHPLFEPAEPLADELRARKMSVPQSNST